MAESVMEFFIESIDGAAVAYDVAQAIIKAIVMRSRFIVYVIVVRFVF